MYYDPNNPYPYEQDQPGQTNDPGNYIPPTSGQVDSTPPTVQGSFANPNAGTVDDAYNGGSPPAIALRPNHGWEWTGSQWVQVEGRGIGWKATPPPDDRRGPIGGDPPPSGPAPTGPAAPAVSGVPTSWNVSSSTLSGSVPTLADAIRESKQLKEAPPVNPYATFKAPDPVGLKGRNDLINAILNRPQVMDQQFQDQLFEQQKETQGLLAQQARQRAAQAGAGRGLSGGGGYQAAAMGSIEDGFMGTLLAGKRDIATQAAKANREAEHAAIDMQEAVSQGDFVRANAAYETQLKASNLYDELRFKAAEFDRANVALAAQTGMAGRQQSMAEQTSSFQQFLEKLKFEELMRQFNEQIGLDYGKFGWQQQNDIMNKFPK